MSNNADVTGGDSPSQSISGANAINNLAAFYDIHERKREVYSFILSETPHEKKNVLKNFLIKRPCG
jgi:hypothetical protein